MTRNLLPVTLIPQPDEKYAILSGVQNLIFTYYDGIQWETGWDTGQQTNLPYAIKVHIDFAAPRACRRAARWNWSFPST